MIYKIWTLILILATVHVTGQNVVINDTGNPNETGIMMDPNRPHILVAGSNLNHVYTSSDTGRTWTAKRLNSPFGVWGDPVIDVDTAGNFYFFHLSNPANGNWIDRIVCQKSIDDGATWNSGTFTGLNGTKAQDKQWSAIDRNNGNIYLTWTQFDNYGSSNPLDSSLILFSRSTDNGASWSTPKRINKVAGDCIDKDNTVEGATPTIGPNGEIYVAWAGPLGLVFNRSTDQGNTWLNHEILIDSMPGGWDYHIPGIMRANGLPITKCDLSGGPNHGTIYVNWSEQRTDTTDTDIYLTKSTDGGNTWSAPVRVNDDTTNAHQFFTWMDIDQTTGHLYFVFYDRRNRTDMKTDVFMAVSEDGGNSFLNVEISEEFMEPDPFVFFGDYTNIVAHNGVVRPIWTRLHYGQLSVLTDITPLNKLISVAEHPDLKTEHAVVQYPNPATEQTFVSFKLHEASTINLAIYNLNGELVKNLISNEKYGYGKHVIPIDLTTPNLPAGNYLIKLYIDDQLEVVRTTIIK